MRKIYLIISILIVCQAIEIRASDENDVDLDEVFRHEKRQEDDNELSEYSRRQMEGEQPQLPSPPESSDQETPEATPSPPMVSTRKSKSSSSKKSGRRSRKKKFGGKISSRKWGRNKQKAVDAEEGGKGDSGSELGPIKPMEAKALNGPQMGGGDPNEMNDGPPMGGPGGPGGGPFGPGSGGPFGPGGAAPSALGGNQPPINQGGKSGTKKRRPLFG